MKTRKVLRPTVDQSPLPHEAGHVTQLWPMDREQVVVALLMEVGLADWDEGPGKLGLLKRQSHCQSGSPAEPVEVSHPDNLHTHPGLLLKQHRRVYWLNQ